MSGIEREEEEQRYHDAGRVSRRHLTDAVLHTPIRQLPHHEPVCVPDAASVLDALRLMQERRIGAVAVVDRTGRLVGIFTERDVLTKVAGKPGDPARTPVSKQMTANPVALRGSNEIGFALNKMCLGGYRHIPLVDDAGKPVGMLSMRDVAHFLVEFFPEDIVNLPSSPAPADDADGG